MNGPIRRVSIVVMVMFLALMVNLSFSYAVRSPSLTSDPQNRRVRDAEFGAERGDILVGNTPIAKSVPAKNRFQRTYPSGSLYAPVTGYMSFMYGSSGLERAYSSQLAGTSDAQFLTRMIDLATGASPKGANVQTTLDARGQQAASDGLAGRAGAVVALDWSTGAVLTLVSSPSFDPSALASLDLDASKKAWESINKDDSKPMSNRAVREIYPPGSTFKLVVSAAALDSGITASTEVDAPTSLTLPGSTAVMRNAGNCGGTKITLKHALQTSCNTAFANLGINLGQDALRAQAEKFGFGSRHLSDLEGVASRFPRELDDAQTAMSAIGQFEVAASPLQMAMVAAGIANDGVVMEPYVVSQVRNQDLSVISKHRPQVFSVAMTSANAASLQDMMVNVVNSGTGSRARIDGVRVGGKTGTAHTDKKRAPYAWFVAFSDDPKVAVAVFVQDAGVDGSEVSGGRFAAPIAKAVIEAMR